MVLEIATILLGACVGAIAVLYAAPRGYFGHRRMRPIPATSLEAYTQAVESKPEAPAPVVSSPAPAPAPALYENVQPAAAPVTYAPPSTTSFGAPSLAKKPTRTYRRRTAPTRSTVGTRTKSNKPKKR